VRTRVSVLRVLILAACLAALVVAAAMAVRQSAPVRADANGSDTVFAAYVDVTNTPMLHFEIPSAPARNNLILGFVVADHQQPCAASWGYFSLDQAASKLDLDRRIEQLRSSGGDVSVSFGGLSNKELATACTDADALRAAYTDVIDRYNLHSIDLDVEGDSLTDKSARVRRASAIRAVQQEQGAKGNRLTVWLTLPVSPTGLTDDGYAQVEAMLAAGVELAGVNGMVMDFGQAKDPQDSMAEAAIKAATELQRQIGTAYARQGTSLSGATLWKKVGLTPMIGQNDVAGERFTLEDATDLNNFAISNGVGLISMWSLNRDATCGTPLPKTSVVVRGDCSGVDQGSSLYTEVLANGAGSDSLNSSSVDAEKEVQASPAPDDPATSPYPIWDAGTEYTAGTKIVWRHSVYQAKWTNRSFPPDTQVVQLYETPWRLIGPVLPGDKPAPLPSMSSGTYPQWSPDKTYQAGARVLVGTVPYQAKWWNKGEEPKPNGNGDASWTLVRPSGQ
jgi:chitinase